MTKKLKLAARFLIWTVPYTPSPLAPLRWRKRYLRRPLAVSAVSVHIALTVVCLR
jgi:hypothetical protein